MIQKIQVCGRRAVSRKRVCYNFGDMSFAFREEQKIAISKILKGFVISTFGALLAGFVTLSPEIGEFLRSGGTDQVDFFLASFTTWGAFSSGLINAGYRMAKFLKAWAAE